MISIKCEFYLDNSHNYDYNKTMKFVIKQNICFFIVGSISLVIGGIIYVLLRENTYVSIIVREIFSMENLSLNSNRCVGDFLKYYFVDYLWAVSLSCGLHIVLTPFKSRWIISTGMVLFAGGLFDLLQYMYIVSGTGDIADITMYFLAALTVNFINLKRSRGNEKNS